MFAYIENTFPDRRRHRLLDHDRESMAFCTGFVVNLNIVRQFDSVREATPLASQEDKCEGITLSVLDRRPNEGLIPTCAECDAVVGSLRASSAVVHFKFRILSDR